MILKIDDLCISKNSQNSAKLTAFKISYSKITKNYTSATGESIIYGIKNCYEEIQITIECNESDFKHILAVLNGKFIYSVKYNRFEDDLYDENSNLKQDTVEKSMQINGNIETSKIYSSSGGLYTISLKFEEV